MSPHESDRRDARRAAAVLWVFTAIMLVLLAAWALVPYAA